jgi:Flp pilus assembly protein TadD
MVICDCGARKTMVKKVCLNIFISGALVVFSLLLSSCGKTTYESNDVLSRKAINAGAQGKWLEAQKLAQKAVDQNGKDANARTILALALEQCEEEQKAIEEINQAVIADPDNFMAQYTKGRLLFKNQRYQDCPDPLEKANELKPDTSETILLLARTYAILDVPTAISHYVSLAKHEDYRDTPEPYNELGVLFMKKKDYKRALTFFKEAYSKENNNIPVNINLAIFWDTLTQMCGDNIQKARRPAANSIKYYIASEKLLVTNPQAEGKRKQILTRIRELKAIK